MDVETIIIFSFQNSGKIKLFHVKDYLAPKEIQEKGLAPILDAMEVADYANPKQKVPLLRFLWHEDKVAKFSDIFGPYIQERGACLIYSH